MSLSGPRVIRLLLGAAIVVASIGSQPVAAAGTSPDGAQAFETPAAVGADGQAFDRSNSGGGDFSVGSVSQPKNVTTSSPGLQLSFSALNHFNERFGSNAGRNQFSLEPPDQGLCVGSDGNGHTRVVEALNDIFQVYDTSGNAVGGAKPQALNLFFGYAPSIIRGAGPHGGPLFGPFVTDPSCLYDSSTGRWFVDVLTLDTFPTVGADGLQHFVGTNHLDIRYSLTSDPSGAWSNTFQIDVTDDGTNGTPNDHCSTGPIGKPPAGPPFTHLNACLGDYPHIGSNADGIFLTTNEYSLFGNEFHGAHIYAISKTQLTSGGPVTVATVDTHGADTFGFAHNGFTLWPSVTPTSAGYGGGDSSAGGTEYFLSSNAAAEAHDTGDGLSTAHPSTQILEWSLTGTSSLGSVSTLSLHSAKVDVGLYAPPPSAEQKAGNQPQKDCLNSNPCDIALNGIKDPFAEKSASLDSNDTRMQQVTFVNGSLWGALDTGVGTSNGKQAGIEWFKVSVSTDDTTGDLSSKLANAGYVALGNDSLTYPAIGITTNGTGVMAFTVVGSDFYPSAGYALISDGGVGDVHIAAMGAGPDDGFTDYRLYANPPSFTPRPRWGDYGAAVPWGGSVWLASESINQTCDFSTYKATAFRCNDTRSALANWGTTISEVSAG